jgi:serine/threonine protein kinase/tetratricopeptide (TPR) repeat protein
LGFDCLHRVAQSYLGPLWIAADLRDGSGSLGLLRRLALPEHTPADARREIATLGRKALVLDHPNVLGVREVIEQGEQLVMLYAPAEAEPLRSLQSWANLRGLSFPVGVALRITIDLLAGLGATHQLEQTAPGLCVSGGLSPDSVLVARDGSTRLSDPLIASGAALIEGVGFNTAKLAYAAPEQVHGALPPTPQTDVFCCAAMLWELLASRRLLAGSRPAIERKLLDHNLPGLRASLKAQQQVSDELVALVERALAADPSERPQSAAEFAQRLGECQHELAPLPEVEAFVGKLSGPRFDRRTAAIRSRSSGSLALDGLELPKGQREKLGAESTSEVETPRAPGESPASERGGAALRAPRPAPSVASNGPPSAPVDGATLPSAPRPAASAPSAAQRLAASAAAADVDDLGDLSFESEPSPTASPLPWAAAPPAPFSPAPVEPPGLGFAPAPSVPGRNPALWDQMVAPTTPPLTHKRSEPFGVRTMAGLGGPGHPALAASLPFANLTPPPFRAVTEPTLAEPDIREAAAEAPGNSPLAPPVELPAPPVAHSDPFGVAALHAAAAPPAEGPLPFEHLLRSKRGPSPRLSVEPGSQKWFELNAQPKSATKGGIGGAGLSRPLLWIGLVVVLAVPVGWFTLSRRHAASAAASAVRAEPTSPSTPAPDTLHATPAPVTPAAVPTPSAAPDAGADPAEHGARSSSSASPSRAGAADFTAPTLDDSQLVVLFALEGRATLPTCAERLGASIEKYSGNDMLRSTLQIKAARKKLAEGDVLGAHELACSAVAHSPRNPAAQRTLADLALQLGDPAQAKTAVDRALAQTPKDKGLTARRGDVLAVMGDIAGGRSIWLRGAVAKGNKAARTKKLVQAYRKAGDKALATSDWAEAAAYFRRAVVLTHGAFAPSLGLSEALLGLDRSSAALVWAERAAQAFPKDSRIQVLFGDALYENGQNEKAREAWKTALDVQPSNRLAARRLREGKP